MSIEVAQEARWRGHVKQTREKRLADKRADSQRRYALNPLTWRERHLLKRYGMTLAAYDELLTAQGGGCAICGVPPGRFKKSLHVDHCHQTGRVRGILCYGCNLAVGCFERGDKATIEAYLAGKDKTEEVR